MTDDESLPRRELLSGLATIGTIGAFSGGAAALLSDEELFLGNLLVSGELDLGVCWEAPGEDCAPTNGPVSIDFGTVQTGDAGTATIRCALQDNPGWVWLRTNCPGGPCGIERAVEVTLWYDDCDGELDDDEQVIVENMRLCDALAALHDGILLDGDPSTDVPDPLAPDEECCLGFAWDVVEPICVEDDFELTFEFHTEQSRHNTTPANPFTGDPCGVDCTADCPDCTFQGISSVSFCVEDGDGIGEGDVSFTPTFDIEGEPYKLDWTSAVPVEWVVLSYGSDDGKFFENFHVDGDTSGTVHVNSQEHTPDDEDFDSKLRWDGGMAVTDEGQCPSDPCPDFTGVDYGCGIKYNFDDGVWENVCGQSCPGEGDGGGGG